MKWTLSAGRIPFYSATDCRIEPAGAGGATGASLQLRRHQLGRGGRWRRSRHLRRVQRPRQGGIENGPSRRRVPGGTPFFECTFHEIAIEFCSEPVQKAAEKKLNRQTRRQTHTQTESSRYRARPWPCFGQFTRRYHSQMPPKPVPKTTLGFLLTSRLKSTSGLPRSLHSPQMAPAAQLKLLLRSWRL